MIKILYKTIKLFPAACLALAFLLQPAHAQPECSGFIRQEVCEIIEECAWEDGMCFNKEGTETESEPESEPVNELENPSAIQVVEMSPPQEEWTKNELQTSGMKFLIRGKEALSWSLNIKETGYDSQAVKSSYIKVLTIVNSLFILGLLAIAAMWMLSIIIPRQYLKRVILIYAGAVIFVNFALPVNQLLISGTNLLQKTLLTSDGQKITITDIVQTPPYEQAAAYQENTEESLKEKNRQITVKLGEGGEAAEIGKIEAPESSISGTLVGALGNQNIELNLPAQSITLKPEQELTVTESSSEKSYSEQSVFTFLIIIMTGIAYFILALIFILRIVILWALLILSPVLLLLAVFRATRGWFINWLNIYGRWLLIGPLTALGIAVMVNIWQVSGLPVESAYNEGTFTGISNISFYLPGKNTPNTLSGTNDMMEYMVFLMMLYLPVFFAFALTRKVTVQSTVNILNRGKNQREIRISETKTENSEVREERNKNAGLMENFKDFVDSKISKVAHFTMPKEKMTENPIPSASSFLAEQLKLTGLHGIMELAGAKEGSRKSREETIKKLASVHSISDIKEKKHMTAVHNEIERRAAEGDPQARVLIAEIRQQERMENSQAGEVNLSYSSIPDIIKTEKTVEKNEEKTIERVTEKETERSTDKPAWQTGIKSDRDKNKTEDPENKKEKDDDYNLKERDFKEKDTKNDK